MVYLKVRMSGFVYTSEQEIAILRHIGIQEFTWFFHPFCPFHQESPFLGIRRKVYVSGRDLLGIRSREPESVILGRI